MRPGSVSNDRLARDLALLKLLEYHAPRLRHSPVALAYVRPALTALEYGADDGIAEELAARAMQAGFFRLARNMPGIRLLVWQRLSRSGRRRVRRAKTGAREFVKMVDARLLRR
jgi:hypothetical protein